MLPSGSEATIAGAPYDDDVSYSFDITAEPIPDEEPEAWAEIERLRAHEDGLERNYGDPPGDHFLALHQALTARYPCITTPEGEDSPWADGPLIHNFGAKHTVLAISFSRVADALPFIITTATELGFTLFDPQDEKIYRPASWRPSSPPAEPAPAPTRPWWKIW